MSIPLDRLYHYINDVAQDIHSDTVIIYRFYPHGSKKLSDLIAIDGYDWPEMVAFPQIFCNDQEPLTHSLYEGIEPDEWFVQLLKSNNVAQKNYNNFRKLNNIYDKAIILHSEKRSHELEKYKNSQFIPAYYWSHAIISQDWFRYAQHIAQKKKVSKTFLIYNRAWSGTREYRLRFAELLVAFSLQNHCKTSINPVEPELNIHYETHNFKNPAWRPSTVLENFFPVSNAHSHYSADFDIEDYEATDIEVVLETLFDDPRLHLTEKSLRPIVCGQPFILAGTHGSLEYLRSYGFKTFESIWDESYDLVEDPAERLIQIAELMKYISNWTPQVHEKNMAEAQAIAEYNKNHFFSKEFFNQVTQELKDNLALALKEIEFTNTGLEFLNRRKQLSKFDNIKAAMLGNVNLPINEYNHTFTRKNIAGVVHKARKYYIRSLSHFKQ